MIVLGCVIVFFILLMVFMSRAMEDKLLKGFYRADAQFCEKAELVMFVLYLGDNTSYITNCRNGYLLAANSQGIILNNPIRISLSGAINLLPGLATCKNYNASIDWQESPPDDPETFPDEFQATFYPKHGKLVLYQGDQVLATLWKDSQMSALGCDDNLVPDKLLEESEEEVEESDEA